MSAAKVIIPHKVSGDELSAQEINDFQAAVNANAEILDAILRPIQASELADTAPAGYVGLTIRQAVLQLLNAGGVAVGGLAPNQAPSVTINGNSSGTVGVQQNFQAIASDSDGQVVRVELCRMATSTALINYTVLDTDTDSPFVLNWTPGAAGTFFLRMRAVDNKGAATFSSALAVQVQPQTTTPPATGGTGQTVFQPANTDYSENQSTATDGNGVAQPNPTARLFFATDAASLSLEGTNAYDGDVSLFQENGTLVGSYVMGSGAVAITLPGSGSRKFYFQLGGAQRTDETGPVLTNGISKLTFPAGSTTSLYQPAYTERIALLGDSITVRGGDNKPSVRSLGPYLRGLALSTRSVTMLAYGARKLAVAIYDDAAWAITRAQILAATQGGTTRTLYVEASTNDYGLGSYVASDLAAKLQTRLADLHAADAGLRLVMQTMLLNGYEGQTNSNATGANRNSATPAQWRTAFEQVKGNLPYVILAKGQNMISGPDKLSDGTHPNQAGNDQYFPAVASYLSGAGDSEATTPTEGAAVTFTVLNDMVQQPAGTWVPTAAAAEGYGHTAGTGQYLPAGQSGRVYSQYYKPAGVGSSALFGFKLGSGAEPYSAFLAAFSVNSGTNAGLYLVDGGSGAASNAYTVTASTYLGVYRDGSTGKLTLQRWTGSAWVDVLTFAATSTAALYLGLDVYNHPADTSVSGALVAPRGTNLVGGGTPAPASAPTETTFRDALVDNSAGRWVNKSQGGAASISNGMHLAQAVATSVAQPAHFQSAIRYDITGCSLLIEPRSLPAGNASAVASFFLGDGNKGSVNTALIAFVNGTVYGQLGDGSQYASVPYATDGSMRYFRIHLSADASTIYCQYSSVTTDESSWTTFFTVPATGNGYAIPVTNALLDCLSEQSGGTQASAFELAQIAMF